MTHETPRIVILDGQTLNPGDLSWEGVAALGQVEVHGDTPPDQVVERLHNANIALINKIVIDAAVMDQCPQLRFVGVTATGYNTVDVAYAASKGITVCNVPSYSTESVVQMVFAHILNHACRFTPHVNSVSDGDWVRSPDFCYTLAGLSELAGKTLGIVGLGQTGMGVARVAQAFGMRAIAYHYRPLDAERRAGVEQVDLDTLFTQSDYISLHVPLTPDTEGLVNRERLAIMPPHAFLVNTARGGVIVEQDLADALNGDRIAGAGLDVLIDEPPRADNPLLTAKNCHITPHIAWITKEARQRLLQQSVDNVQAWLSGAPINVVSG